MDSVRQIIRYMSPADESFRTPTGQIQQQIRRQLLPEDTLALIFNADDYLMHHEMTELMSGHISMEEDRKKMMQSIAAGIKKACAQEINVYIHLRINLFKNKICDYEKSKEYLKNQIKRIGEGNIPKIENLDLSFEELNRQVESPLISKLEFYNYLIVRSTSMIKAGQQLIAQIQKDALLDGCSRQKQELLQKASRIQQLENERATQDKLLQSYREVLSQASLDSLSDFSYFYDGIPVETVKNFKNSNEFKAMAKAIGVQWALSENISKELISMLNHFEGFKMVLDEDIMRMERDSAQRIKKLTEMKRNLYGKGPLAVYSAAQIQAVRKQEENMIAPLRTELAQVLTSSVQAQKMLAREYALQRKLNPKAFNGAAEEIRATQMSIVSTEMADISVIVDVHDRLLPDFNDSMMDKI